MDWARILIAMSSDASNTKMKAILTEAGFNIIDQALDSHECIRKIRSSMPDITLLELNSVAMSAYEIAEVALEDKLCDIIAISAYEAGEVPDVLKNSDNFVLLTKPLNKAVLINTLTLMLKSRRKIKELEKEINELRYTLDTRKEVEKAKGLLMKHLGLSEKDAFKRIQKQSMDRGIPMKEIAKAIILTYEL